MSISSKILSNVNNFRNSNNAEQNVQTTSKKASKFFKVLGAEVAYLAMIPFSIIETALNSIAWLFGEITFCRSPEGNHALYILEERLKSSSSSILLSVKNTIDNLIPKDFIFNELQ